MSRGLLCLMLVTCKTGTHEDPHPAVALIPDVPAASSPRAATRSGAADNMSELPSGTHTQSFVLGDTTVRYTILVPEGYSRAVPAPLIVMLHYGGYDGDVPPFYGRGMIEELAQTAFRSLRAIIIAPDSVVGDWTTAENDAAVVSLTLAIMSHYAVDPAKVVLSGYSMGGIGTWHIGNKHQDLFTAAIPIASAPAGDAAWTIPLYVIHSRDDKVLPIAPVRDHVNRLKAAGARIEWRELAGLTHYNTSAFAPALTDAGAWLERSWRSGEHRRRDGGQ
jgi:predicted peptidase